MPLEGPNKRFLVMFGLALLFAYVFLLSFYNNNKNNNFYILGG